jgi:hypothetical protein
MTDNVRANSNANSVQSRDFTNGNNNSIEKINDQIKEIINKAIENSRLNSVFSDGKLTLAELKGFIADETTLPFGTTQRIFDYYNNSGGTIDSSGIDRLFKDGVLSQGSDGLSINFSRLYGLAGISVDGFIRSAVDHDGSALDPENDLWPLAYDANRDSVLSPDEILDIENDRIFKGYNPDGSIDIDTRWRDWNAIASGGTGQVVLGLSGLPEGSTATFSVVDRNGNVITWIVVDGSADDGDPASGSISFNVPSDSRNFDPAVPFAVVLTGSDGTKLGETYFTRDVDQGYVPATSLGSSLYNIDSSGTADFGNGNTIETFYFGATKPDVSFQSLSGDGTLSSGGTLNDPGLIQGITQEFLITARDSDEPALNQFYYAYLTLTLQVGDTVGSTTYSQADIDNLDKAAASQYISDVLSGVKPGGAGVVALYTAAAENYISGNYTILSDGSIVKNSDLARYDDEGELVNTPIDALDRTPTTRFEFYQAGLNEIQAGGYDGATNADGTPFDAAASLAFIDNPVTLLKPPVPTDYNNEYDLQSVATLILGIPAGSEQDIFTILQKLRPLTFVTGNLAKLTPQQQGDFVQLLTLWAADYSKNPTDPKALGGLQRLSAYLPGLSAEAQTRIRAIVQVLDKTGSIAVLAGLFGVVGGALGIAYSDDAKTTAAGVHSIVASTQYANKYGSAVAAFADAFFKENLGATRLDQYISYGSTYGQQVGGRGSAALLATLPATIQDVNFAISREYRQVWARNPTATVQENLLTAISNVKEQYASRNIDIPTQYAKFSDRLTSLVSQVDSFPGHVIIGDLLAKLSGSAATERGFALTLAAIQGGAGNEVFGVRFNSIDRTKYLNILEKNNIRLTSTEISTLENLVAASQQYKGAVAAQNGTVADRTLLDAALAKANDVFKTSSSADDIASANTLAADGKIAQADGTFIASASKFAKAFGGAPFIITGIFGAALGITTIVRDPNDPVAIAEGSLGIAAGGASVVAGLAALGLLPAVVFPPALIIAGVLGAPSLIFPFLNPGGPSVDLYGGVDFYQQLEDYGFAKPGSTENVQKETDAYLDEEYPESDF